MDKIGNCLRMGEREGDVLPEGDVLDFQVEREGVGIGDGGDSNGLPGKYADRSLGFDD